MSIDSPVFASAESGPLTCDSCGRSPAVPITVRRHVGLIVLQQFITMRVNACRSCGRSLVRRYTLQTLWQGWWGLISFFFNWFVLAANALAWRRASSLQSPSVSGELIADSPTGFRDIEHGPKVPSKRRSWLKNAGIAVIPALLLIGFAVDRWGEKPHDHEGAHGAPMTLAAFQRDITGGSFTSEDGTAIQVSRADCTGDGDPVLGRYTHFRCNLAFTNGTEDDVTVHLLQNGDFFFVSEQSG